MRFAPAKRRVSWPWSAGSAWGTVTLVPSKRCTKVALQVLGGRLALNRFELAASGTCNWPRPKTLAAGRILEFQVPVPA
jgi:hypothetical protein